MMSYCKSILLLAASVLFLNSCGSGGGGGVGTISSSSGGTFTSATISVPADVAVWTGTPCATGSTYTVLPDSVNVTFTAFNPPAGSTGDNPEQVVIDSVTITYQNADSVSPALPASMNPQYQVIGQQVVLGGTVTFPVEVAPLTMKTKPPISSLICTNTIYSYYATMAFACHFLRTGNTFVGSTAVNVRFADFAN
jgi:hypothetical protein